MEEGDDEVLEAENCDADEEVEEDAVDKVASGDAEKMMLSVKKKVSCFISPAYHNRIPTKTAYLPQPRTSTYTVPVSEYNNSNLRFLRCRQGMISK